MESTLIFVYGLLRTGINHPMARYLKENASALGHGYFYGKMYDTGSYPAVIPFDAQNTRVYGDIYELIKPEEAIKKLDAFEEIGLKFRQPYEYKRELVDIHTRDAVHRCWIYLYNRPITGFYRIESGDFLKHTRYNPKKLTREQRPVFR